MNNRKKSTKRDGQSMNSSGQARNKARVQNKQMSKPPTKPQQAFVASAYSTQNMGKAAIIKNGKDSVNIVHKEFIGNISGAATSAFTSNYALAINPGILETFPWLATIAQNWETYLFNRVRLCYYTRTGSTTVGSVLMAPDYDASDAVPSSEQTMSSYSDIVEDVPWKDNICTLKKTSMHSEGKRKFVRTGTLGANLDIKTYDAANVYVNSVDSVAAAAWGKLWIEYDVTLFTPTVSSGLPIGIPGGRLSGLTAMTGALPFGTGGTFDAQSRGVSYAGTGPITLEKIGTYILTWNLVGTVITAFPAATLVNATLIITGNTFDAAATGAKYFIAVITTANNATVFPTVTATTVTASILYVAVAPDLSFA